MSCDGDANSCYDDVTGDWISEQYLCLMYSASHYMNFQGILKYLNTFNANSGMPYTY